VTALFGGQKERALGLWRETLKRAHEGGLAKGWFQPAGLALVSAVGGVGKGRWFTLMAQSFGAEGAGSGRRLHRW